MFIQLYSQNALLFNRTVLPARDAREALTVVYGDDSNTASRPSLNVGRRLHDT